MLALALLAAHMLGDFVFQTRWQAARKLVDAKLRARHVTTYSIMFVPVAVVAAPPWRAGVFVGALFALHFLTDSRRFRSTLGDVLVWRLAGKRWEWRDGPDLYDRVPRDLGPLPPTNPWPALPILIDQTLHVAQIAALGWLLT